MEAFLAFFLGIFSPDRENVQDHSVSTVVEEGVIVDDSDKVSGGEKFLHLSEQFTIPPAAPELEGLTNWINSDPIGSMEELRGKVVLIDFWTYSCINCIRTLPHVQALHEKYGDEGFVLLGLHAPEFAYERKKENVEAAVKERGLTYPIAQDNDFTTWGNYNNRYWPAHYLIDRNGFVRYTHFGEGKYAEMDQWVAKLLAE